MTTPAGPNRLDPLSQEIQTRHPGIGDEIEGAIKTLRRLKQITGTVAPGKVEEAAGELSLVATTETSRGSRTTRSSAR